MSNKTLYEEELKERLSNVKFYENPVLTPEHEIIPGNLIEALPWSPATMLIWDNRELITKSPTNIFGYVRGEAKDIFGEFSGKLPYLFEPVTCGDLVVEKIVPVLHEPGEVKPSFSYKLHNWAPDEANAYLVVGEVGALPADGLNHLYDDLTDSLYDKGVILIPEQLELVRKAIYGFIRERQSKGLVFTAPDTGNQYPLEEIVLSLAQTE
jgi:hypothetical protein